jgi:enoyl-CoA hydratase/carnithine racemase
MSYSSLRFEVSDRIGVITFTNEDRLNAITEQRLDELEAVLGLVESDEGLGALILSGGEGRSFCVGLDLDLLDRAFADVSYFEQVVRRLHAIISRLEALPIPTLAAVNGYARAGGFEISLGCDFIFIAEEAKYGDVHTDAGVIPACATLRLARKIGEQRAKDIIFSARWLTGPEAVAAGVALRCVPRKDLLPAARDYLRNMIDKPRACLASVKSVFQAGSRDQIQAGAELELKSFVRYMREQPYGREGYQAFREGRTPSWKAAR